MLLVSREVLLVVSLSSTTVLCLLCYVEVVIYNVHLLSAFIMRPGEVSMMVLMNIISAGIDCTDLN